MFHYYFQNSCCFIHLQNIEKKTRFSHVVHAFLTGVGTSGRSSLVADRWRSRLHHSAPNELYSALGLSRKTSLNFYMSEDSPSCRGFTQSPALLGPPCRQSWISHCTLSRPLLVLFDWQTCPALFRATRGSDERLTTGAVRHYETLVPAQLTPSTRHRGFRSGCSPRGV